LIPRHAGELTDHRDEVSWLGPQRQDARLVLQQHRAFGCGGSGQRVVGVHIYSV
jgi:hypothetical protein